MTDADPRASTSGTDVDPATDLRNRVIIVTGGTRGIGRGVALHLGHRGAEVVITGRRQARLDETSAELTAAGIEHLAVVADVADRDRAFTLVAETTQRFGRLDGLVLNAQSFRPVTPLAEVT
ncbi:MAG: SDR family NAD(P)-dependent oxidoreductase, partial [Acidimicrobiia bacterium]